MYTSGTMKKAAVQNSESPKSALVSICSRLFEELLHGSSEKPWFSLSIPTCSRESQKEHDWGSTTFRWEFSQVSLVETYMVENSRNFDVIPYSPKFPGKPHIFTELQKAHVPTHVFPGPLGGTPLMAPI